MNRVEQEIAPRFLNKNSRPNKILIGLIQARRDSLGILLFFKNGTSCVPTPSPLPVSASPCCRPRLLPPDAPVRPQRRRQLLQARHGQDRREPRLLGRQDHRGGPGRVLPRRPSPGIGVDGGGASLTSRDAETASFPIYKKATLLSTCYCTRCN